MRKVLSWLRKYFRFILSDYEACPCTLSVVETGTRHFFTDIRNETHASRVRIGFSRPDSWRDAPAYFDEHSLVIEGHPVMEDWEEGYMQKLAAIASMNKGIVLEVGFGMGISAGHIQHNDPEAHLIIEANRDVFERLKGFTSVAPAPVFPFFGFWQDITRKAIPDESLSGILFDTYPLSEQEIHRNHFAFFNEAHRMLAPGGVLTYYSDEIDAYSHHHLTALREAGFKNIGRKICTVSPPPDCEYWKSPTILAPIVIK